MAYKIIQKVKNTISSIWHSLERQFRTD